MSAIAELGALLTSEEAGQIAADLRMRRLPHLAAKRAYPQHRSQVRKLLTELLDVHGEVERVAAALEGMAAVPRIDRPDLVWTSPSYPGSEGRTTLAALQLINDAEASVIAATYSAEKYSPHLKAMRNVIDRGVAVTIVVDVKNKSTTAAMIAAVLPEAQLWHLAASEDGAWAIQHAKLIAVDDRAVLVTSANFSDAAAWRSLECGLISKDPLLARGVRRHLELLHRGGVLVDYDP